MSTTTNPPTNQAAKGGKKAKLNTGYILCDSVKIKRTIPLTQEQDRPVMALDSNAMNESDNLSTGCITTAEQDKISNRTSPHISILPISTNAGVVLSVGDKTPKPKKTEVHCTSIFRDPANISGSINKLWAEVVNIIENAGNAGYNEDMQRYAYPNSEEFEVSGE